MYLKDKPSGWSKRTTPPCVWLCVQWKPSCRFHTLFQATVTVMELYLYLITQSVSWAESCFSSYFSSGWPQQRRMGRKDASATALPVDQYRKQIGESSSFSWRSMVLSGNLMFWRWSEPDWKKSSHYSVWFHHFKYICGALLRILPINNAFFMWSDLSFDAKK